MKRLRINMKLLVLGLVLLGFSLSVVAIPKKVATLSGGEFQAGRIMDDGVFFNSQTMSANDIQVFLNTKVPVCDTNGTQPYAGTTRAAYSISRGYPPPFTCLKDYSENVTGRSPDSYCAGGVGGGTKSSAQIIYDVSTACGINPQVLIVLLQKEQSLVTDDWPWSIQYRSATGYGCPDTAACDSTYYGFFNQVYNAARQFRRYSVQSNLFNYRAGVTSYVQYNPNGGCGGSNIYMQNQATAGLYNYTPYQPNASALNNLYGTGDSCGAYGNRNFWRMFNDWFGSTYNPAYSWQMTSQYAYTDATKTTSKGLNGILPGDRAYIGFTAKNTGNQTWTNTGANPIMVGTVAPLERQSAFSAGSSWLSPTRPSLLKEASVPPGGTGTFEFWITIPNSPGAYNERFGLIANNAAWFNDTGLSYFVGVAPRVYSWQMTNQNAYTNQTKTTQRNMANLVVGDRVYVTFSAKNTGNVAWQNSGSNAILVGTVSPLERSSSFSTGSTWLSNTRPALLNEASVPPGSTGTFEFWMTANSSGTFNERFNLIANNLTWFNDTGLSYFVGVAPRVYSWQFMGQWAYTDANRTIVANMANMHPGDRVYVRFTAKNIGNQTWTNTGANPIMAGTANPFDRISSFAPGSSWLSGSRPVLMQNPSIAPGETATFEFTMTAPNNLGVYNERFNLIANNLTWFNDTGLSYYAKVN